MSRKVEISVGLFLLIVICSVLFVCFKVADPSSLMSQSSYRVYAVFDNIGGLKAKSPIKIGGVVIGRVDNIILKSSDNGIYQPYVAIDIDSQYDKIPSSSSLSIKTSGLLGEQFVDVNLGIDQTTINEIDALDDDTTNSIATNNEPQYFTEGFVIHNTKPALVIEDLIGQLLYSFSGDKNDKTAHDHDDNDSNIKIME